MHGWMDGWMYGSIDGWMEGLIDRFDVSVGINVSMDECMYG